MGHVSYTDLRQNLARYLDEAAESRAPLLVTRQNGKGDVVMLSAEEFAGWQETVRLLSSPRNAERLMRSIRQLEAGQGEVHELIEDDQAAA
ncbi:MAG TPA: type II toxin-antitoxin system prevent-host-death family antitoxin [Opitutaceae bacterium]|jgi:antitoxin YefM|nr:type II toxin-antitoxin system prevent-host-death family antitoxin [Opitutaceae bacterium]